ncbi:MULTISPECIES: ABC transporter permease [unclassified Sporosarcina]|uniref:ABC transporter permease n=1 Tax=unclassified Sporosarcina TaxID=2647733 RepID=UPI000C17171B|nr:MULTISPECIES: ABC transporter permease [unclassified Sporosarcina]PIC86071.1 ABC transporter permease [Sporosarcina sp. P20a]PID00852.1 ABC transporter permease [Sporosarcina sp. P29]PID07089.1 ABC transporter permease [Sporosarcina sp. P30]PID10285.1 ABC transporter permease [Sporosarcina sp. P31]PID12183.1 ABC transporter permease [Sporosarcina sp. P32b]
MTTALRRIVFLGILVAIWEVTSKLSDLPDFMFPSFTQVMSTLISGLISGQILIAIGASLSRLLIGFTIASILGLVLGYLIWRYKIVEDTLGFLVTALQSIPSIVWFPLAIIWFGLNDFAILFIVTLGATWTMIVNATSGFKNVPVLYQRVAKSLGSSGFHFLRTVILPASVPQLISGLRIAWAFSWRALMAGELLGASVGLGQLLESGRALGQMDLVISVMIIIGVIGTIMDNVLFLRLERSVERKWGIRA